MVTSGYLTHTRVNSFLVKKFKFAQKRVGSGIRLSREQIKTGYAIKTFLFNQILTEASGLFQFEETKI